MNNIYFEQTISALKTCKEIDCIVLGGSRATNTHDENSDYDVYVYVNNNLDKTIRKNILEQTCSYCEIDNTYWETEDDCILKNNQCIELIYRRIIDFDNQLSSILIDNKAHNGFTTCMCYNFFNTKILYDPKSLYQNLLKKYSSQYPQNLKENIISKNRALLDGKIPSYTEQIKKSIKRKDSINFNNRMSEFLSSYFDIIFAINELYHPGEKRLILYCLKYCKILPLNFEENLNKLINTGCNENIEQIISDIIYSIDNII